MGCVWGLSPVLSVGGGGREARRDRLQSPGAVPLYSLVGAPARLIR